MKKLLLLFTLLFSVFSFASTAPFKIVNNTPYHVNYHIITCPPEGGGLEPQLATTGDFEGLITLGPYSSITYDDPGMPGIPYNLFGSWDLNNNATQISGAAAYATYGTKFRWGKFKFFISENPFDYSTSIIGANVGPIGDAMVAELAGLNVTWTPNGDGVTIFISEV